MLVDRQTMKAKKVAMVGLGLTDGDVMRIQFRGEDDGGAGTWYEIDKSQAEVLIAGLDIFIGSLAEKCANRCLGNGACVGVEHIDGADVSPDPA